MQQYKLKRGFKPEPERIYQAMQESFPVEISRNGDRFEISYGALSKITVWIEDKTLCGNGFRCGCERKMKLSFRPTKLTESFSLSLRATRQKSA